MNFFVNKYKKIILLLFCLHLCIFLSIYKTNEGCFMSINNINTGLNGYHSGYMDINPEKFNANKNHSISDFYGKTESRYDVHK